MNAVLTATNPPSTSLSALNGDVSSASPQARAIAFYLPQFYPIPENDVWWGKGFTEWTNVTKAQPLFPGHYQPQLPRDLGFYDLRVPETREAQATLARDHGIEAFCYWHYWFAGERLLDRPFQEVLASGKPDFPFCLGWANHTWNGLWSGGDMKRILKEQTYPGKEDDKRHFDYLLTAFRDPRYVCVDGKPLLIIYKPLSLPDSRATLSYWRELADGAGLPGLHIVATLDYTERSWDAKAHGFDAITVWTLERVLGEAKSFLPAARFKERLKRRGYHRLHQLSERQWPELNRVFDYGQVRSQLICDDQFALTHHPMAVPNWDTTARYDRRATILHDSTPEKFRLHLRDVISQVTHQPSQERIIFIKSWNEWAEGNYLEPDERFGCGYLEVIQQELMQRKTSPVSHASSRR